MKKKTANQYFSWYILLRDAIKLAEDRPGINQDGLFQWCECCTCHGLVDRFSHKAHAGHFFPKGMGGGSGIYYDERNVHTQCYSCNEILEGNRTEYYPFMVNTYGKEVIEELRRLDKLPRPHKIVEYGTMYRESYKELLHKYNLEAERKKRGVGKWKK